MERTYTEADFEAMDLNDLIADTLDDYTDGEPEREKEEPPRLPRKRNEGRSLRFEAEKAGTLMPFLLERLKGRSRTTVKSYLSHRQTAVNGIPTTQFDHPLKPGDEVTVNLGTANETFRHPMLSIVYEDDHLLVVNKKNGLLTMATDRERKKTAYYLLSEYLKQKDPTARIFIVHRLDRETSGLLLFAKSMEIQHRLQQNWNELVLERKYVAVAGGRLPKPEGVYSSYLVESKAYIVYSTQDPRKGELATTGYRVLKEGAGNSLVELELETGKKNQIRVHLKDMGCPIIGDKKYGGIPSPIDRVALHASKIRFIHPVTHEEMSFDTGIPALFQSLLYPKTFRQRAERRW